MNTLSNLYIMTSYMMHGVLQVILANKGICASRNVGNVLRADGSHNRVKRRQCRANLGRRESTTLLAGKALQIADEMT